MRGVAAYAVLLYHYCAAYCATTSQSYLAVDFFFVLSGLVIGRSYEQRIRDGMTTIDFVVRRLIRLWPLYIVGIGFAVVRAAGQVVLHDPNAIAPSQLGRSLLLEVFMLPSLPMRGELFPLNGPAWSLFFEMVINIIFAVSIFRSSWLWAIVLAVLSAAALVFGVFIHGTIDLGFAWPTFGFGMARVAFSFSIGVLLNKILPRDPLMTWFAVIPVVLIGIILVVSPPVAVRPYVDLITTLVISPLLVAVGAFLQAPQRLKPVFEKLGDLSYPIYAVHMPLIFIWAFGARKLGLPDVLILPGFVVFVTALALVLEACYDIPVRKWLSRLWKAHTVGRRGSSEAV